jgi:hypothetical protein
VAHRLEPVSGHPYLTPTEVIRRLGNEFEWCAVGVPRDQSTTVTISDGEAAPNRLTFAVAPNEGLFVEYDSPEHEAETCRLLSRCAAVLGYECVRT